ncbi:MAG: hypothetical protein HY731_05420, partial [Candidatus Tectomicrobia bacterium]|nr:hypothetical protein [Candidatus Tectomicrobia bacterium]
ILEEAAELAIRASLIGRPKVIPREMAAYTQERAEKFARKGKIRAK